jgi:hypothetical protein
MNKQIIIILIIGATALTTITTARAEQGGSAHYMPGQVASFIDAFPGKPGGLAVLNYFTYYDASVDGGRQLPLGGFLTTDLSATVYADTLAAVYQTRCEILGGGLAFGLGVPYVWLDIEGQAQRIGPGGVPGPVVNASDSASGVGDLMLIPFMLGWTNIAPDLKVDARLAVYAPTGDYEVGQLANVGKNYWTFEPGVMASWISSKLGTEVSFYAGVDFNLENEDMDYTSGTSLHLDLTVAQHLPLGKGDDEKAKAAALAKATLNPIASLISLPIQNNFDWGAGRMTTASNTSQRATGDSILAQRGLERHLPDDSALRLSGKRHRHLQPGWPGRHRPEPLLFAGEAGEGRVDLGCGPVLQFPTATDDLLGEEKWGAGPTAVVLKQEGPWTYGALVNHIWSFAGERWPGGCQPDVRAERPSSPTVRVLHHMKTKTFTSVAGVG